MYLNLSITLNTLQKSAQMSWGYGSYVPLKLDVEPLMTFV